MESTPKWVANLIIFLLTCLYVGIRLSRYLVKRRRRFKWAAFGQIVVHCPPPGAMSPCVASLLLKWLTYLRLADIPYQLDHEEILGPESLTPWITLLDGTEVTDIGVIVTRLQKLGFESDPNAKLTAGQAAAARAFMVMVEEHLCWCLREWRILMDKGRNSLLEDAMWPTKSVYRDLPLFMNLRTRTLNNQGAGHHPHAQGSIFDDLRALSEYLGDKPYLMGDEMAEVDCSVFAQIANIYFTNYHSQYYKLVADKYPNLFSYMKRIKARLWTDWDDWLAP